MAIQERKLFTLGQKLKFAGVIIVFFLIIIILIGEVIMRISHKVKPYSEKTDMDTEFGWYPKSNFSMEYNAKSMGKDGEIYPVHYHTEDHGFREWGDVNSSKLKLLFVGDSYVQSVESSNEYLFYNHISDTLDAEIFAFGQAGYGTYQEYMIIDKYLDIINPDLIIWQSCDNDFIDNHVVMEYNSLYKVGQRRPYFKPNGSVVYRQAKPKWHEWVDKSLFLGLILDKIITTSNSEKSNWTEKLISKNGKNYEPYAESIIITRAILKKMKSRVGDIPIVGITASLFEPQLSDMKDCSESNGIPFYDEVANKMESLRWSGVKYFSSDTYHWNEAGQLKVAEYLIPIIQNHLPKTEVIEE